MKNFDEDERKREFVVKGKTFHYRHIRPETLFRMIDKEHPWQSLDQKIMQFLPMNEHEAWRDLRANEDDPIPIKQLNAIYEWLVQQATGKISRPVKKASATQGKMAIPGKRRKA